MNKTNKCPHLYDGRCIGDCGRWCTDYNKYNGCLFYHCGQLIGYMLGLIIKPIYLMVKKIKSFKL